VSYQASGTIRCWKKYDCLGCGAVYRHRFSRSVSGAGGTAQAAEANAQRAGMNALRNQVDSCPCPECGRVQPRMVGHSKLGAHTAVIIVLAIAMVVLVILGATDVLNRDASAFAMAGTAALGALTHFLCAASNPNANPEANKRRAAAKVASGTVEVLRSGDPSAGEPPPPLVTRAHMAYFVLALLAAVVALVPVAVRLVNGWTLADTDPPVLGPGDRFRVSFPDDITCVKGLWSGSPRVTFEDGVQGATVTSNNDTWGASIAAKRSETDMHPKLWADITFPNDERLSNRELRGRVDMTVRYPQASGDRGLSNREASLSRAFTVRLSTPYAWRTFRRAWWGGLVGCFVVAALAGWGFARLASGMKWNSPPDLVEAIDAPPSDQPPEDRGAPPSDRPWERRSQ
jgi:hypothetical protein